MHFFFFVFSWPCYNLFRKIGGFHNDQNEHLHYKTIYSLSISSSQEHACHAYYIFWALWIIYFLFYV